MFWKQLLGLGLLLVAVECQKLPVQVYYESLCPDSAKFINTQLAPIAKDLLQYVELMLIPYGKSSHITQGSDVIFTCHHGPNECYGNKIHACVVENVKTDSFRNETQDELVLNYVDCLMSLSRRDAAFPIEKCAKSVQYKMWENIEECANSTMGSKILQKFGEETMQFQSPLKSVPTVVFDKSYSEELQNKGVEDFRMTLCAQLHKKNVHAKECHDHSAAPATTFSMVSIVFTTLLAIFYH
ncbi:GILT-like protein 1 [Culicoides brevitarsis]|uniref:GILT-like protein 1 n=1 Tax=Culicoides brevitarsis TaxID=469753 RepID=UPI00307C3ABA